MGINVHDCMTCYWSEWDRCEIQGKIRDDGKTCHQYLNDKNHSEFIKRKLMVDPDWCKNNWNLLDDVDRLKYYRHYGGVLKR